LVYQIGAHYGFKLDMGHAKEFLATVGVGMASQVVEGYLARFVGTVSRKFAGRVVSSLLSQATESALAFGTTYAIGQTAMRYYASGRKLSTGQLQEVFNSMLGQGRSLKSEYLGEITQRASQMRTPDLLSLVKQS
jgi:uncharacterized protein (DUF697 family)